MQRKTLWFMAVMLLAGCIGKKGERSGFKIYGVEWVGDKVGVLGLYTRYEVFGGGLIGERVEPKYSRDVMFFVDPSTIHQDPESGWWIVEADSVWIIHQVPRLGGGDLWQDPLGRGWWLGGKLYDHQFNQVLDSLPCWEHTYPVGDTLYYLCATGTDATPDTVKRRILSTGTDEVLFTYPIVGLLAADAQGRVYITGGSRLLRWEGGDSFTVVDSPVVKFGFKGDTLVTEKGYSFYLWFQGILVDSLSISGELRSGQIGHCFSTWKWFNNMATTCHEADVVFCASTSQDTGGVVCTTVFAEPPNFSP